MYELNWIDLIESRLPNYSLHASKLPAHSHIWLLFADFFSAILKRKEPGSLAKSLLVKLESDDADILKDKLLIMVDWIRSKSS